MKIKSAGLGLFFLLITLISAVGCGGGGGGGVTGPIVETPVIPANSAFALPAGFSSAAFPAEGPVANITLTSFAAGSTANLYLMNFSSIPQALSWSAGATFGASARPSVKRSIKQDKPISPEQLFHLQLRKKAQLMPVPTSAAAGDTSRASIRAAVGVGSTANFNAYVTGFSSAQIVSATCRRSEQIPNTVKKIHLFVANGDLGMSNLDALLDELISKWNDTSNGIYVKNRSIFGEEPYGMLSSGVDATDFYILLARNIYTAGYFYTGDLSSNASVSDSNMKKMFNLQLPSGISLDAASILHINTVARDLLSTMAHEFQHMIHYQQRGNIGETWLEEAMSGYAEYANNYRIENGLNQSKALQSNEYFERISDISFNKWHDEGDSGYIVDAYYGKAYLFGVWLAQHYAANGDVRTLLSQRVGDEAAIEAFTGKSIEEIFAKFMMALSVNDATGGSMYGIRDLNLTANYTFGANLADVKLNGPSTTSADATAGGGETVTVAPYSAAYVRVSNGNGDSLYLSANLPQYSAIYQLRKN